MIVRRVAAERAERPVAACPRRLVGREGDAVVLTAGNLPDDALVGSATLS